MLYHDSIEGNVHVSLDEGKSWKRVEDIPKGDAAMVIEHPFNNRYVSLFSRRFVSVISEWSGPHCVAWS